MKGKRLISVLLSLVLVLNIAFAIEGKAAATDKKEKGFSMAAGAAFSMEDIELMQAAAKKTKASDPVDASDGIISKAIYNSSTSAPQYENALVESMTYRTIPITTETTGWVWFDYQVTGVAGTNSVVTIEVTDEANANIFQQTNGVGEYVSYAATQGQYYVGNADNNKGPVYMKKGEVYYAIVANWGQQGQPNVNVGIRAKTYTTGQRTLYQGTSKWTLASGLGSDGYYPTETWFKVKPDKSGVMVVSLKEYGYSSAYGIVRLYSSSKNALSNSVKGSKAYFGVNKGTTYYLKVTECSGTSGYNYKFGIKYSVTARTDRDLNSKSEAKKLTRKAGATNTLFKASTSTSSSATTDWYKIYVSSKRKTRITVNTSGMHSGEMYVTLYKGSKKIGYDTIPAGYKGTFKITTNYSDYATKGTYYVKVKKSKYCSGKYSIRYDQ